MESGFWGQEPRRNDFLGRNSVGAGVGWEVGTVYEEAGEIKGDFSLRASQWF